jgi:hypothetical protein
MATAQTRLKQLENIAKLTNAEVANFNRNANAYLKSIVGNTNYNKLKAAYNKVKANRLRQSKNNFERIKKNINARRAAEPKYTKTNNRIYHTTGTNVNKYFAGKGSVWINKAGYGFIQEPGTTNYKPIIRKMETNVTYHNKNQGRKAYKVKAYLLGAKSTNTWNKLRDDSYLVNKQPLRNSAPPSPVPSGFTVKKGNVRMVRWENKSRKRFGNGASINNIGGSKYIMVNGKYRPVIGYIPKNQKGRRVATISLNNKNILGKPAAQPGISNLLKGK